MLHLVTNQTLSLGTVHIKMPRGAETQDTERTYSHTINRARGNRNFLCTSIQFQSSGFQVPWVEKPQMSHSHSYRDSKAGLLDKAHLARSAFFFPTTGLPWQKSLNKFETFFIHCPLQRGIRKTEESVILHTIKISLKNSIQQSSNIF